MTYHDWVIFLLCCAAILLLVIAWRLKRIEHDIFCLPERLERRYDFHGRRHA